MTPSICPACAAVTARLDRLEAGQVAIARAILALADAGHAQGAAMSAATRAMKTRLDALEAEIDGTHDDAKARIAAARDADAAELGALHDQLDRLADKCRAFGDHVAGLHRDEPAPREDGYVADPDHADEA